MDDENSIVITYFINPHLFWYYYVSTCKEDFEIVHKMESEFQLRCKGKSLTFEDHVQLGDHVAVLHLEWEKYIRAEVLYQPSDKKDEFVVWATDYGFPLYTKKNTMCSIPSIPIQHSSHIKRGGIAGIVPKCGCSQDLLQATKRSWSQEICDMLEKKLNNASLITFIDAFQIPGVTDHHWGNVITTNQQGRNTNIRNYLLGKECDVEEYAEFESLTDEMKTIKIPPWMSNDRKDKFNMNSLTHHPRKTTKETNKIHERLWQKIDDWHNRNARQAQVSSESLFPESVNNSDFTIDNIEFDDSVPLISKKQERLQQQQNNKKQDNCDDYHHEYTQKSLNNELHVDSNDYKDDKYDEDEAASRYELLTQKNFMQTPDKLIIRNAHMLENCEMPRDEDSDMSLEDYICPMRREAHCDNDYSITTAEAAIGDHKKSNAHDQEQRTLDKPKHNSIKKNPLSTSGTIEFDDSASLISKNQERVQQQQNNKKQDNCDDYHHEYTQKSINNELHVDSNDYKDDKYDEDEFRYELLTQKNFMRTLDKLIIRNAHVRENCEMPRAEDFDMSLEDYICPMQREAHCDNDYSTTTAEAAIGDHRKSNAHDQEQRTLDKPKHNSIQKIPLSTSSTEYLSTQRARERCTIYADREKFNTNASTTPSSKGLKNEVHHNYDSMNAAEAAKVDSKNFEHDHQFVPLQEREILNKSTQGASFSESNTKHLSRNQMLLEFHANNYARREESNTTETPGLASANLNSNAN